MSAFSTNTVPERKIIMLGGPAGLTVISSESQKAKVDEYVLPPSDELPQGIFPTQRDQTKPFSLNDLPKFGMTPSFMAIYNPNTYIHIPYAFGFDYEKGDPDNRDRLAEYISGMTKILCDFGFAVSMAKDGTSIKARFYNGEGEVERYWKISLLKEVFEADESYDSSLLQLVANVWKLTGDGFDFYDVFQKFKVEVLKTF